LRNEEAVLSPRALAAGIVGSLVAAVCCFTPILVVLFGAVGLSAWLGWADYVVMPALVLFLALTGYEIYRQPRNRNAACDTACAPGSKDELRT
jgi:mercuric ion transport protein